MFRRSLNIISLSRFSSSSTASTVFSSTTSAETTKRFSSTKSNNNDNDPAVADEDTFIADQLNCPEEDLCDVSIRAPSLENIESSPWYVVTQTTDKNLMVVPMSKDLANRYLREFGSFGVKLPIEKQQQNADNNNDDASDGDVVRIWNYPDRCGWTSYTDSVTQDAVEELTKDEMIFEEARREEEEKQKEQKKNKKKTENNNAVKKKTNNKPNAEEVYSRFRAAEEEAEAELVAEVEEMDDKNESEHINNNDKRKTSTNSNKEFIHRDPVLDKALAKFERYVAGLTETDVNAITDSFIEEKTEKEKEQYQMQLSSKDKVVYVWQDILTDLYRENDFIFTNNEHQLVISSEIKARIRQLLYARPEYSSSESHRRKYRPTKVYDEFSAAKYKVKNEFRDFCSAQNRLEAAFFVIFHKNHFLADGPGDLKRALLLVRDADFYNREVHTIDRTRDRMEDWRKSLASRGLSEKEIDSVVNSKMEKKMNEFVQRHKERMKGVGSVASDNSDVVERDSNNNKKLVPQERLPNLYRLPPSLQLFEHAKREEKDLFQLSKVQREAIERSNARFEEAFALFEEKRAGVKRRFYQRSKHQRENNNKARGQTNSSSQIRTVTKTASSRSGGGSVRKKIPSGLRKQARLYRDVRQMINCRERCATDPLFHLKFTELRRQHAGLTDSVLEEEEVVVDEKEEEN